MVLQGRVQLLQISRLAHSALEQAFACPKFIGHYCNEVTFLQLSLDLDGLTFASVCRALESLI
jgi:hypothetical protein